MNDDMFASGSKVFVRTVTHYYTGEIETADERFLVLRKAAWIAETGRFGECLAKGVLSEVEPYPDRVAISIGAIVDVCPWEHELPRVAK